MTNTKTKNFLKIMRSGKPLKIKQLTDIISFCQGEISEYAELKYNCQKRLEAMITTDKA